MNRRKENEHDTGGDYRCDRRRTRDPDESRKAGVRYLCLCGDRVILFSLIVDRLGIFIRTVEQITSYIDLDSGYLSTMFKMIGITYIAEFSSGICKDAGYQTLAGQIEIFGKLTILVLGLPVLLALLQTIQEFLS